MNSDKEKKRRSKMMRELNLTFVKTKECANCHRKFVGRLKTKYCCRKCADEQVLFRAYGIRFKDYAMILKKQKGLCAICRKRKRLVIDHDHKTGKTRGLVCQYCNTVLTHIDNSERYSNILKHLQTTYESKK